MIRDRSDLETNRDHVVALDCIENAIHAAAPENATRSNITLNGDTLTITDTGYDLTEYEEIILAGVEKPLVASHMRSNPCLVSVSLTD